VHGTREYQESIVELRHRRTMVECNGSSANLNRTVLTTDRRRRVLRIELI